MASKTATRKPASIGAPSRLLIALWLTLVLFLGGVDYCQDALFVAVMLVVPALLGALVLAGGNGAIDPHAIGEGSTR